jgi:hypothetical protein
MALPPGVDEGHGLVVVADRSRIDLTARPPLDGVRLVVESVTGAVHGRPGGQEDLGWLVLRVRAVPVAGGSPPASLPDWLAVDGPAEIRGTIVAVEDDGDGRYEIRSRFGIGGHAVPLTGIGRCAPASPPGGDPDRDGAGTVEASGLTLVDPRVLGFGVPLLVTHTINARWRIVLAPAAHAAETAAPAARPVERSGAPAAPDPPPAAPRLPPG